MLLFFFYFLTGKKLGKLNHSVAVNVFLCATRFTVSVFSFVFVGVTVWTMDQASPTMEKVQADILTRVADLRKDGEANDVTFVLGKRGSQTTREVPANSTILSISSPYFRAMFHGPMRSREPKRLPDIEPHVFEKVLDFVHGNERCLDIGDSDMAWDLKYAAKQFLMPGLEAVADAFLREHLSFKNGLVYLSRAATCGAFEMRAQVHKVLKHHATSVLSSDDVSLLPKEEMVEVVKLFFNTCADTVMDAVLKWSSAEGNRDDFSQFFEDVLVPLISWETMSREYFCEHVYGKGLLSMQLENDIMYKILASPLELQQAFPASNYVLRLSAKFISQDNSSPFFPPVRRVFARTSEADFVPNVSSSTVMRPYNGEMCIEANGLSKLKNIAASCDQFSTYQAESSEAEVFYHMQNEPTLFQASNVKLTVFRFVLPTNRSTFLFEVSFDPVDIVPDQHDYFRGIITATLHLQVEIKRSLLLDLNDSVLLEKSSSANPFSTRFSVNNSRCRAKVLSWSTWLGPYKILPSDRYNKQLNAAKTPSSKEEEMQCLEYNKPSDRIHVPFVCQLN